MFAGLIRFCSITDIISLEFSPWTLERRYQLSSLKVELVVFVILRPVDHNFWNIPVYRTFRCFAEDYYSGLNFYILCLDIKRLLQ